ncbi:MAG: VOC family protein [Rhodobiaceae bacterium]|nr:VOC family protein [Rhodobiaceae bacterium]MCC0055996.1 VOC family protein [Rhodobiaceae bacterium]
MKLWVHHLNIASANQPAMHDFYRNVLGMGDLEGRDEKRLGRDKYAGACTYLTDDNFEFHIAQKDDNLGFAMGQYVNPVAKGHLAFRTDDLEAFKRKLEENGVPYSDFGIWGMTGWTQIFFHDPAGNVIEVHQLLDEQQAAE